MAIQAIKYVIAIVLIAAVCAVLAIPAAIVGILYLVFLGLCAVIDSGLRAMLRLVDAYRTGRLFGFMVTTPP